MKLIEKLKAIRALIDTPEKWTKGTFARDKDGNAVKYYPDAVCYCLAGADAVICPESSLVYDALADVITGGFRSLSAFNDHPNTTHADVMALIDRAIEAEQAKEPLQNRVAAWMLDCFTPKIAADKLERSDRFIEEALELVQACNYSKERAHALVEYVFNRPKGENGQEVGGVMITLAALCGPHGLSMDAEGEREYQRITRPEIIKKIRAKQASKPRGSALPIPQGDKGLAGDLGILLGLIEDQIELNPSNYDHDDACRLNAETVEIATNAMQSLPKAITALRNNTAAVEALEAIKSVTEHIERYAGQDNYVIRQWQLDKLEAALSKLPKGGA